jgi:hypothetical protein
MPFDDILQLRQRRLVWRGEGKVQKLVVGTHPAFADGKADLPSFWIKGDRQLMRKMLGQLLQITAGVGGLDSRRGFRGSIG